MDDGIVKRPEPDRLEDGEPWRYKAIPGEWHILRMTFRAGQDVWVVQNPQFKRLTKTGESIDLRSNFKDFESYTAQTYHTLDEAFALAERQREKAA